jgi:hypothetical protein
MASPLAILQSYQGSILPAANAMQIDYAQFTPFRQIFYGIALETNVSDYENKSGMSYQNTDAFSGDQYNAHVLGATDDECLGLIKGLIQICNTFTGDADYSRIYPTTINNIIRNYEDQLPGWRHMSFLLRFAKNNIALF